MLYGTALWQVGDSKEQNGSFNIAFAKAKQDLLHYKIKKMTEDSSLRSTDLMPLINFVWANSFARVEQNKKAIVDRGWNPLNYNLLTNSELRATMTIAEKLTESTKACLPFEFRPRNKVPNEVNNVQADIESTVCSQQTSDYIYSSACLNSIIDTAATTTTSQQSSSLKFSTGMSAECLTALVSTKQLMEARERIKKAKSDGEDLTTRLKAAKRITAEFCWKKGTTYLGKIIFEVCKVKQLKKRQEARDKMIKEEKTYLELKQKADAILASGKGIEKMSNKDLSIIPKSLKKKRG